MAHGYSTARRTTRWETIMSNGLLPGKLPNPPIEYNQQQWNQIIRQIQQALNTPVELRQEAEDREALDFFLSK